MVCAMVTIHDDNYAWLSNKTWDQNAKLYCEKWGYKYFIGCHCPNKMDIMFNKIRVTLDFLINNTDVEWVFWKDCDSLITNFNIRIEDFVNNDYHIQLTTYSNGINAGMFTVRNTPEGRSWLYMILEYMPQYMNQPWREQQVMIDTLEKYRSIIQILPQRTFNSACFSDGCHQEISHIDLLGTSGQWEPGDFIMHWPGQPNWLRQQLLDKYFPLIEN